MAQLLSPVCTDTLKFPNPLPNLYSRNQWSLFPGNNKIWSISRKRKVSGRVRVTSEKSSVSEDYADDYYAVLGLLPDATPKQIKKAYYNCMKACHPDLSGDDPENTNFCMFINDVYAVLSDPVQRMIYDEIHGYALSAINPFLDDSAPKDHVFVDEFSCIGCKNCTNVCPDVFTIEEDFGRARAYSQSGYSEFVSQAIESCPVDCIHWTSAQQLSLLEDEMRRVERVNHSISYIDKYGEADYRYDSAREILHLEVGGMLENSEKLENLLVALMLSGMGSSVDVFRMASSRWEKRQMKVLQQAKVRMMKKKDSDKADSYWGNVWGKSKDHNETEEEVNERVKRAAAASRRWREYSRRGADRPPTFKLPGTASKAEK